MTEKYIIILDLAHVQYETTAEPDEHWRIQGSQISGDPDYMAEDLALEADILRRFEAGDVWGWAVVTVTATVGAFTGQATLGGVCYPNEAEFQASEGESMRAEALDDLRRVIRLSEGRRLQE